MKNPPLPHKIIDRFDLPDFKEPSGLCYHPARNTLFVVGDKGHLAELRTDGTVLKQKHLKKADFEGITCNPASGRLYLAVEGDEQILEVDPDRFKVLRTFDIERHLNGKTLMKSGGDGIEGIAFVPNPEHPHGGTFLVANQGKDAQKGNDIPAVFELHVPLQTKGRKQAASILRYFTLGIRDLSGLCVDPDSGHLLVISDQKNTLLEVTLQGQVLQAYTLPGRDQEGLAIDGEGFMYIAQDSGGILKIKPAL